MKQIEDYPTEHNKENQF